MSIHELATVLVVDDRPNMLRLLQKILGAHAHVVMADGGRQAIEVLRSASVAVVICDLKMPDVDGFEVLRASQQLQPDAAFILMTAHGSGDAAIEANERGAYHYFSKPFEADAVREVVLRVLRRSSTDACEHARENSSAKQHLPALSEGRCAE